MGKPRYSQSEIKAFLKCGKLWEFRYVKGIKMAPSGAATVGISVDEAVSTNLKQKVWTGEDLSQEEVLDTFSTDFDHRAPEADWSGEDVGRQKDVGAKLVRLHHAQLAPRIRPATVQETFVIETDADYDLTGVIDLTEKDGVIADTKTSRTAFSDNAVEKAFQPALYDYAYEALKKRRSSGFRFDVLIKPAQGRPARLQQIKGTVTDEDRSWLFETIGQVHRAIQAGVALPAPEGSWYCSSKWCGYWDRCKGRRQG